MIDKRRWARRPLQLQVTKNKKRVEVRLFLNGALVCWEDGADLREAIRALRPVWLRSKWWDQTFKFMVKDDEGKDRPHFGAWMPRIKWRTKPKAQSPLLCWRCGLGPLFVLEHPLPRCIDHNGVSHYACINQTYDQKIRVVDKEGKTKIVDRPGCRGLSERWDL